MTAHVAVPHIMEKLKNNSLGLKKFRSVREKNAGGSHRRSKSSEPGGKVSLDFNASPNPPLCVPRLAIEQIETSVANDIR
jgi:hypothetical protein